MRNCGLLFSLGKIASKLLDRSRGFALPEGYGDGAQGSQSESGTLRRHIGRKSISAQADYCGLAGASDFTAKTLSVNASAMYDHGLY
jgi:hypothetical protein